MRVERSTFPGIDGSATLTEPSSRSRRTAQPAADEFNSTTADLLALFRGASGVASPVLMERAEVVARLKLAYEQGAIRPDADRIAAAILRNRSIQGD